MKLSRRDVIKGGLLVSLNPLQPALASEQSIDLFNKNGTRLLNASIGNPKFWNGSDEVKYQGEIYDVSRLKSLDDGYLTLISGEGGEDFTHEQVVHTVLTHQPHLPKHMSGAKICRKLQSGIDSRTGVPFTDLYFVGDFDFFYGEYFQRMYRFDFSDGRTACAFECLDQSHVSPELWREFQKVRKEELDKVELLWVFNDILPIVEIFGMYFVESGAQFKTRVTLTAKLKFGGDSWLASAGTKIPFVLRLGMESGFEACVAIARGLKKGVYLMP